MARCAMRSGNAVVKCAHSPLRRLISALRAACPLARCTFWLFCPYPARKCLWEPVSERAWKTGIFAVLNGLPDRRTDFFVLGKVVQQ